MPSYAPNQFIDFEEAMMYKQLLSLDLRENSPTSALLPRPVGYQKPRAPCFLPSNSPLCPESSQPAALASNHWEQASEHRYKMPFWSERSVSMVETGSSSSLGWSSPLSEPKQPSLPLLSPTSLSCSSSSLPTSPLPPSSSISSRYKTELCRTFAESGICKYGGKCQFAHGMDELRDLSRHPKYKTEPCRTFHTVGFCPYGTRCHFVHNNEDDQGPPGRQMPALPTQTRRPPLKHSFSFAGFPSAPPLAPEPSPMPPSFLRASSISPPAADITDLLCQAFQLEVDLDCVLEPTRPQAQEPRPQFLPSPDSGCSACGLSPASLPQQSPPTGPALGGRSLSYTSLSDQEGACSSASSLSGSDSSSHDASGRRLPIFSQLSVPDDGLVGDNASFF